MVLYWGETESTFGVLYWGGGIPLGSCMGMGGTFGVLYWGGGVPLQSCIWEGVHLGFRIGVVGYLCGPVLGWGGYLWGPVLGWAGGGYLWGAVLVGVHIPRPVVGGELEVIFRDVLVTAAAALSHDGRHDVAVAQVHPDVLVLVRGAGRPRPAPWATWHITTSAPPPDYNASSTPWAMGCTLHQLHPLGNLAHYTSSTPWAMGCTLHQLHPLGNGVHITPAPPPGQRGTLQRQLQLVDAITVWLHAPQTELAVIEPAKYSQTSVIEHHQNTVVENKIILKFCYNYFYYFYSKVKYKNLY